MFSFIRKPYFIAFIVLYVGSVFILYRNGFPSNQILVALFSFALILPLIAYFVSIKTRKAVSSQPFFDHEWLVLSGLILYIVIYISWGDRFVTRHVLPGITVNPVTLFVLGAAKDVVFYFLIPFLVYRSVYGFTLREAGLRISLRDIFSIPNIITFLALSAVLILFQYLFNTDLELLWEGEFESGELLKAIPTLFFLLLFKAGLALGFFFHSLLQSRLSIGLNSKFGGMIISVLIFGFAHLPLLIEEGIPAHHKLVQSPGLWMILAYCIAILAISHLFIAIIWRRSKNLWLVMGLYAVMEILPDLIHFLELRKP